MKNLSFPQFLFSFLFVFFLGLTAFAQNTWEPVGPNDHSQLSPSSALNITTAVSPGNELYIAYQDGVSANKATVKKFNGTSWVTVGAAGFSAGGAYSSSMAFSGTTPYLAYQDGANGGGATVMKFDGTNWVNVGSAGFTGHGADYVSLAFNGTSPYVAYRSSSSGRANVMRFDGANWVTVGSSDFSAGGAQRTSLAFDGSTPYVAYVDQGTSDKATVKKFDGTNWVTVGSAGFSAGGVNYTTIAFSGSTPYVAYEDYLNTNKVTVMTFNGSSWVPVGSAGLSAGPANYVTLAFNGTTPYVAYKDGSNSNKVNVKQFDGSNWVSVGSPGISANGADYVSIRIIGSTPYVAYRDELSSKATVKQFDGSNWINTGPSGSPGISAGTANYVSLRLSGTTPYMAYQDVSNSSKATVTKFNGSTWSTVGTVGFSASSVEYVSLAMNGTDPYVAYKDNGVSGKATMMRFDGSNWVVVGSPGFSAGTANFVSLAFNGSTPYVAYLDGGNGNRATVMRFDGSNWVAVGSPGFSAGTANYVSLAFSGTTPYVAYQDIGNGNKATVMRFDGTNWVSVGSPGLSAGTATYVSLAFSGTIPYVAYRDGSISNKVTVKQFNGSSWVTVGALGFSADAANYVALAISGTTPFVAYQDSGNLLKATVMKFDGSSWITVGTAGISVNTATYTSLALNGLSPYVAYSCTEAYVKYFDYISSDANLSDLILSNSTLVPTFSPANTAYLAGVSSATASTTVTPTVVYAATVQVRVNGGSYESVISGSASSVLALNMGSNTVDVKVTAQDGTSIKTYTISVYRGGSSNADLSALNTTAGAISPSFSSAITEYNASVANTTTSVSVTPAKSDANASIGVRVNGGSYSFVSSGSASSALALNTGNNAIEVRVISQDGTIRIYTITVTRALSSNADLSALTTTAGEISPSFSSATTAYSAFVLNATSSVTVTPAISEVNATIAVRVNGGTYAPVTTANPSSALSLNVGINTIDIKVTAEDGTIKIYTITVTRSSSVVIPGQNTWQAIGPDDFSQLSPGSAFNITTAVSPGNELYIAYQDGGNVNKATVKKFNGTSWVTVGSAGFSAGSVSAMSLAFSGTTPYLAFQDGANSNRATVMKFDGTNWVNIGSAGFTSFGAEYVSLAFNGTSPYVAYRNSFSSRANVMRFDGANWVTVGTSDFSAGGAQRTSLAFDGSTPYVAYVDQGTSDKATVKKFDGTDWVTVGSAGFSAGGVNYTTIVFSGSTPYVAYEDYLNTNKVTVMTFDGSSWVPVGSPGLSAGPANYVTLAFNGTTPYVAYKDGSNSNKVNVKQFDGSSWVSVGSPGISANGADYVSIRIIGSTPYVAYRDELSSKATVKQFDGSNWINTGPSGSPGISAGTANYVSLRLSGNTPYMAYQDLSNSSKATVTKFNGSTWSTVGTVGFSASSVEYVSLAMNGTDPYVAYRDNGISGKATVMRYNGSSWVVVGSSGFSAGTANYVSLAFNGSTPYVAYLDGSNGSRATVMRFDGSNWVAVGSPGFSAGTANYVSLAFSGTTPYVAYQDASNGNKATVMRFDGTNWVSVGSPGLSAGTATYVSLAFSGTTPYVAYRDGSISNRLTVKQFNGSSWVTVGALGFSVGVAQFTSLAISGTTPFVSYQDGGNSSKATVMKFDGSAWVAVGTAGFSASSVTYTSLAMNGPSPYLAYSSTEAYVKFFNNISSDANLSDLILSSGTLLPGFSPATTSYTASVSGATSSITVTPAVAEVNATVKINGTTVPNATPSGSIPLSPGNNIITAEVTAHDGTTVKTYTITVNRALSSNADLSGLALSNGPLSPAFDSGITSYTASVSNAITSLTVTPIVGEANATIKVSGVTVASGSPSGSISLAVGSNTITTVVTAHDGTTTKTYTVNVNRGPSTNANLSSLALSAGTLSPAFASGTGSYTASVSNVASSVTVTPVIEEPNATIKVNGVTVSNGSPSGSIPLTVGSNNTITIVVTAQDGTTIQTYTITVTRAIPSLPYSESFKYSTAVGMVYGGAPAAAITGGGIDAQGAGYLRLTTNTLNQSGFARNTTAFPSVNGLSISFEYYTHSGSGGDGLTFFLYDATASPFAIGAPGGSLGYAQTTSSGGLPGVSKGYIGIGFDEAGNFSNPTLGRQGGPGQKSNSVTLRGDGNGAAAIASNYEYLTGIQTSDAAAMTLAGAGPAFNIWGANGRSTIGVSRPQGGLLPTDNGYRKAKIELTPNGLGTGFIVNVWITEGNAGGGTLHHLITDYSYVGSTLPSHLSYGFSAATGGYSNMHEIRNLDITVPTGAGALEPTVTDIIKNGSENSVVPFTTLNFTTKYSSPTNIPLSKIKVLSLPANGTLKLSGTDISVNQEIPVANLSAITFVPNGGFNGSTIFQWNGSDGTSYAASHAYVTMTLAPAGTTAFPYYESFKNSTAAGLVLGGTPAASLTAATTDSEGAGYLRLTNNLTGQSGFARNTREFPTAEGFSVSFEYYTYGGTAADGISFFLYDAMANGSFQIGAPGGSLGYAQNSVLPGVSKGYLGVGLDEFGGFSTGTGGRMGGPGSKPSSVTIRGDGNGLGGGGGTNYEYLTNIQTSNAPAMSAAGAGSAFQTAGGVNGRTGGAGGLTGISPGYRKAKIEMTPNATGNGFILNVWITEGNAAGPIEHHVVTDHNYLSTSLVPANLSYGFAGSTGGYTNFHEIRNLEITLPGGVSIPAIMAVDNSFAGNNMLKVWSPAPADADKKDAAAVNQSALPAATNILSPNKDGKNDTWVIRNLDKYPTNTVTIVDRNGKVVYRKENYRNDWDGTYRGVALAEDTYYYIVEFGKGISALKGFISIIR